MDEAIAISSHLDVFNEEPQMRVGDSDSVDLHFGVETIWLMLDE